MCVYVCVFVFVVVSGLLFFKFYLVIQTLAVDSVSHDYFTPEQFQLLNIRAAKLVLCDSPGASPAKG